MDESKVIDLERVQDLEYVDNNDSQPLISIKPNEDEDDEKVVVMEMLLPDEFPKFAPLVCKFQKPYPFHVNVNPRSGEFITRKFDRTGALKWVEGDDDGDTIVEHYTKLQDCGKLEDEMIGGGKSEEVCAGGPLMEHLYFKMNDTYWKLYKEYMACEDAEEFWEGFKYWDVAPEKKKKIESSDVKPTDMEEDWE